MSEGDLVEKKALEVLAEWLEIKHGYKIREVKYDPKVDDFMIRDEDNDIYWLKHWYPETWNELVLQARIVARKKHKAVKVPQEEYEAIHREVTEHLSKAQKALRQLYSYPNSSQIGRFARKANEKLESILIFPHWNSSNKYSPDDFWTCSWQDKYGSGGTLDECLDTVEGYIETDIELRQVDFRSLDEVRQECLRSGSAKGSWWSISWSGK